MGSPLWSRSDSQVRPPVDGDREALAVLLLDAYRGTVDDEGESESEALDAVDHYLSVCRRPYSRLVVRDGSIIAMSLVVVVKERHYIDPVTTAAAFKGMGFAGAVVSHSVELLAADGVAEVGAVITDGNVPSERLFTSLGFSRVGAWG